MKQQSLLAICSTVFCLRGITGKANYKLIAIVEVFLDMKQNETTGRIQFDMGTVCRKRISDSD